MDDLIERLEAILAASEPADSNWRYWDSDDGAVAVNVHPSEFQAALREAAAALRAVREAPVAIMDTREFLSLCAPTEDDFPALYALQGQRVRIVKEG